MLGHPRYLRVVITAQCSLRCDYCHQEGDPATAQARGLDTHALIALLLGAVDNGIEKLKFLGGEPLLRKDLPDVIRAVREKSPSLDISLITGGAVPVLALDACFDAGLSRANLSIHGWSPAAFHARTQRGALHHRLRQAMLHRLLERGRFLKLNFVWRGPEDDADLSDLLSWAADKPVVVSVLDDLGNPSLGPGDIQAALVHLRGMPMVREAEPDPHSLPTLRMRWWDGLEVEVKDHQLGVVAPWRACGACPQRTRCREGIHALRLSHDGKLRPCMDRPDISVDLKGILAQSGREGATRAWAGAIEDWAAPVRSPAAAAS
jgi:cyclic pyranopterin phosphate synthase